jgi:putative membrane protein
MNSTGQPSDSRTFGDYIGLAARGFAMGASNIVPGVSGGTMALILGIYEELIASIKAVLNREAIKLFLRFKIKQGLALLPWKFLLAVACGIFLATFSMSYFLEWVLVHYPALLWAFFFGLVAASILTISKRIERWGLVALLGVAIGAVGAYLIVGLVPAETPDTWWFWFLSGIIAICAMVLPGMSGSFILVLLGKYQDLLAAVTKPDFLTLFFVFAGAGIGIVTFAQFLTWLFKRYHDGTVAVLMGMLLGSLRKIWPWKETVATMLDRHGEEIPLKQINVLPSAWTWEIAAVLLLAAAGFALIGGLTAWASRQDTPDEAESGLSA